MTGHRVDYTRPGVEPWWENSPEVIDGIRKGFEELADALGEES